MFNNVFFYKAVVNNMRCVVGIASTFVCPTEIIAFSDSIQQFQEIDCDIVGVSTDSHFSHLAWINTPRKVVLVFTCAVQLLVTF